MEVIDHHYYLCILFIAVDALSKEMESRYAWMKYEVESKYIGDGGIWPMPKLIARTYILISSFHTDRIFGFG